MHCGGGVCSGGVPGPGGVCPQGGIWSQGVSAWFQGCLLWGVPGPRGVCSRRGVPGPKWGACLWSWGGMYIPACDGADPPVN